MASAPQPAQRLDLIDALRGFAALWVFLYHVWNVLYPWGNSQVAPVTWDADQPWHYYYTFFLFQYGYFGVTIFFVVSGFCIHLPQARKHARAGSDGLKLEAFFQRRFWRLYPAYFAGLFVASLSLAVMRFMEYRAKGWPLPLPDHFYEQAFGVNEIGYNALFLLPFFETAKDLNSVLWTLVFEVQFYLLYPLMLIIIRRTGLLPLGAILLLCEIYLAPLPKTQANFQNHNPWDYFFLAKYFEWYLGVVAAELLIRSQARVEKTGEGEAPAEPRITSNPGILSRLTSSQFMLISVVCLLVACGSVFVVRLWPYRDVYVAAATFFFILAMLQKNETTLRPPGRVLKSFVWLGLFSYSLYLLHIPLLRIINAGNTLLCEQLGHPSWERWLILDSIPLVILASWGFFWVFERPFLKPK